MSFFTIRMKQKTISIKEALSVGWELFTAHLWFFLALIFGISIIFSFLGLVQEEVKGTPPLLFAFVHLLVFIVNMFISMGLIRLALQFLRKEKPSIHTSFIPDHSFFPYVIGTFMYVLVILAGIILLIIPGFMWAVRYQFSSYLILDKHLSPREAFHESARMTKGIRSKLFGFMLVIALINILGALIFGIGLLVSIPVTMLAVGFIYLKLRLTEESNIAMEHLDPAAQRETTHP